MRLFTSCVLVLMFVSYAFCSVAVIPNTNSSKYPGKCYVRGPPRILMDLNTSKRWKGTKCGAWNCRSDYSVLLETCGLVGNDKHCRRVQGDPSRPFPYCCDEFIC